MWGGEASYIIKSDKEAPHESETLMLDCNKIKETFRWEPMYQIDEAIKMTVEWWKEKGNCFC